MKVMLMPLAIAAMFFSTGMTDQYTGFARVLRLPTTRSATKARIKARALIRTYLIGTSFCIRYCAS